MKKIFTLLLVASLSTVTLTSCTNNDDNIQQQDNDTIAEVYDINNVTFTYSNDFGYHIKRSFSPALYTSDMILVYQKTGTDNGKTVWALTPRTVYLDGGREVDYTSDFTTTDVYIYAGGTFDLNNTDYIKNQTFRLLVIPAVQGKTQNVVDYNNYDEVIKHFNINDKSNKSL